MVLPFGLPDAQRLSKFATELFRGPADDPAIQLNGMVLPSVDGCSDSFGHTQGSELGWNVVCLLFKPVSDDATAPSQVVQQATWLSVRSVYRTYESWIDN